jgi:hypothetical protein
MRKWTTAALLFYINFAIMLYLGIDRLIHYYHSDNFSDLDKYAYVGGDAYNYIINSNVLIGYFVLATASLIVGTLFIATGAIIKAIETYYNKAQINEALHINSFTEISEYSNK